MNEKQVRIRLRIVKAGMTKTLNNKFRGSILNIKWYKQEKKDIIDKLIAEEKELYHKLIDLQAD